MIFMTKMKSINVRRRNLRELPGLDQFCSFLVVVISSLKVTLGLFGCGCNLQGDLH